jgi:outer membrane protein TolC
MLMAEFGHAGGLTASVAAQKAAQTSPDLQASKSRIEAREADLSRAKQGWYPRLTLLGRYTRLSPIDAPTIGPSGVSLVATPSPAGPLPANAPLVGVGGFQFPVILNQYMAQANLTVPLSDYLLSTNHAVDAASDTMHAAELTSEALHRNLELQGVMAYYAWVRTRLQQVTAELSLEQYQEHARVARASAQEGRVLEADALRAEAELASAELLRDQAKNAVEIATVRLRTLLHDPPGTQYQIGEDLKAALPPPAASANEALLSEARNNRVELQALNQSGQALERQAAVASAKNYPRLDAFGNAYYANPNPRLVPAKEEWKASWDLGLQVSWAPNDLGIAAANRRATLAERDAVLAQAAALKDEINVALMEAEQQEKDAQERVATSAQLLRAAQAAHDARRALYDNGRTTLAELLTAESQLLNAEWGVINALIDTRVARASFNHALGRTQR